MDDKGLQRPPGVTLPIDSSTVQRFLLTLFPSDTFCLSSLFILELNFQKTLNFIPFRKGLEFCFPNELATRRAFAVFLFLSEKHVLPEMRYVCDDLM